MIGLPVVDVEPTVGEAFWLWVVDVVARRSKVVILAPSVTFEVRGPVVDGSDELDLPSAGWSVVVGITGCCSLRLSGAEGAASGPRGPGGRASSGPGGPSTVPSDRLSTDSGWEVSC